MSADSNGAVDVLLAGVEAGTVPGQVFTDDVVLDATVPNWRFTASGREDVVRELSGWFADPGRFVELTRTHLPTGELVEFMLEWEEHGVLHACHQAHILELRDGLVASDTAFCGGRWPAPLLEEMPYVTQRR